MSNDRIVRRSRADSKPAAVDWSEFDALTDENIASAVGNDPDAAPLADEEWFQKAQFVQPPNKAAINIRLDQEVLDFFKSEGTGLPNPHERRPASLYGTQQKESCLSLAIMSGCLHDLNGIRSCRQQRQQKLEFRFKLW